MPGSSLKRDPMFPEAGEYLGQITTQVILQPLAVGHLVRQGDVEQLRSAAITAAACWGGMYGPILTLDEDGDFTEPASLEILGCLSPDVLVDHAWSKASGWANAATSRVPVEPPRSERLPGQATHSFLVHQPSELRGLHVRIPSEERLVNLVGAGSVPELDRPKWAEYGVILDVVDDNDVAAAQIVGDCPLQMTAVRDHVLSATNPGISTIAVLWVTDRDEAFDDLVGFWNLRALRPSNSRAPTVLTRIEVAGSRPFQEQFLAAVADQVGSSVHVALLSETVATGDLEALAADMGLEVFAGGQLSESMGRRQAAPGVLYAAIGLDLTESWCSVDRLRGTRTPVPIQIHRPLSKLRVSSPIEWHPTLLLGGHVGFGVLAPFLSVPRSPSVARLFHRNASWMSDGLRWFTNPVPHYEFDLGAPTGSEVLSAALTDRGVRFELNDKGCQVEGILDATNTDEGLIVHPLFAPIVQALTGKPSRDLAHLLEQYAANGMPSDLAEDLRVVAAFSRLPECSLDDIRSRAESGAGKAEVSAVLDWMARCRLLHRGFRVECAVCGLKDFVLSRAAGPNPTCSGCGSQAGFTASAAGEPEHRYRLSTLLHRVSLNGGLVPLRATAQLRADRYFVVPGANLFNGDEQIGECDLLGWRDRVIFTGEAKTSADYFTLDQAQRDAQLAEAVGASEHVLACARQIDAEVIGLYEGVMTPLEVFVAVV